MSVVSKGGVNYLVVRTYDYIVWRNGWEKITL